MEALAQLFPLIILFGVFYMLLIRPNKRRAHAHKELIQSVEVGDEVVTGGGLYGTVKVVGDEDIELEIAPGTSVRFLKAYILRRVTEDLETEEEEIEDDQTEDA